MEYQLQQKSDEYFAYIVHQFDEKSISMWIMDYTISPDDMVIRQRNLVELISWDEGAGMCRRGIEAMPDLRGGLPEGKFFKEGYLEDLIFSDV